MSATMTKARTSIRNVYTPVRRPTPAPQRVKRQSEARAAANASMRKGLIWILGIALVLLIFLGLSLGLLQIYRYATTSDYFTVDTITINGLNRIDQQEILSLCGLEAGDNSLLVHIPDLEQKLLQNPWVESVAIKRELPDHFILDITERVPQFWVLKDGAIYYLDSSGLLIAPVESGNFHSLPTLDIGPGGEEAVKSLSQFMGAISSAGLPFDPSQISWLRLSAGKGFELYWETRQLTLSIGLENWRDNLQRMILVIGDMDGRGEIGLTKEIRAADGQVWLQKI